MKAIKILFTVLLAMAEAWAQNPPTQITSNQPANGTSATPIETNTWGGTLPYSSQANFNRMEDITVPQGTPQPSTPSYIGVLGEKWETDKRGRRGTFLHHGQEMSSGGYDQPTREPKRNTPPLRPNPPSSLPDSLTSRVKTFPYFR